MGAEENRMFLSLIQYFFHDFCIAKNGSLLSISKLNVLAIKEKREEKTCGCHSYLRMAFFLMDTIQNSTRHHIGVLKLQIVFFFELSLLLDIIELTPLQNKGFFSSFCMVGRNHFDSSLWFQTFSGIAEASNF